MALPKTLQDREFASFIECQSETAIRTKLCQDDGDAIKVELGNSGVSKSIFNQITEVLPLTNALLVSYTIPVGVKFDLSKIICSGDNISKFRVYVAGNLCYVKRTTWGNFNVDFDLLEAIVNEGDKIEVFAENYGKKNSDYESTIIGGESDA